MRVEINYFFEIMGAATNFTQTIVSLLYFYRHGKWDPIKLHKTNIRKQREFTRAQVTK